MKKRTKATRRATWWQTWLFLLALLAGQTADAWLRIGDWLDERLGRITQSPVRRAGPAIFVPFLISLAFTAASYVVNRIFGPKPPKITKGQMTGDLFIQNSDEGSPVVEVYGGAPGTTGAAIVWENLSNSFVNAEGNLQNSNGGVDDCFTDASGVGDSFGSIQQLIASGDFEVTWTYRAVAGDASGRSFVGLKSGSYNSNYTTWNYTIHVSTEQNTSGTPHPPNSVFVYEGSPPNKAFLDGVWTAGDTLRIRCISNVITYWWKDTLLYTSLVAPSFPLRICASMACFNATVEDLTLTREGQDTDGGIKTAGTIIWCTAPKKVTTTETSGGKGAPKQTTETITYYCNMAILFARGRQRLKKLYANADLIVDLDAAVGASTGLLENGALNVGSYSQSLPPTPAIAAGNPVAWAARALVDPNGTISGSVGAGGAAMRFYEGNYDQLPDALIEADMGAGQAPAYRGYCYLVIENFNVSKYGGVPTFLAVIENVDYKTLGKIADHLAERVGVEPGDRDFSPFTSQAVRGLIVQQPTGPRETLEMACTPYNAIFYETVDGILTGKFYGDASVATIGDKELGMMDGDQVSGGGQMLDKMEFDLTVDDQLPRQISLSAYDPQKNWETTTQHAYRMTGFSERVEAVSLPMTLLPDEARQAAERILYQRHVAREAAIQKLPWKYSYVNPSDIVTVVSAGVSHRLRLVQIDGAVPGVLQLQAAADEALVYSQAILGDGGSGAAPPVITPPAESLAFLMDSVMLRDADDKAGYYAAVAPRTSDAWSGAGLFRDRGAGYELVQKFIAPATAGVLVTAVTPSNFTTFDEIITVTVDLYGTTATLETHTDLEVLNGANAAMLGDGMIFQFRTATQVGGFANRWNLTGLLWGRRGSDYAAITFPIGSRFVLLDGAVVFIENDLAERNAARNFKAVTNGFAISDVKPTSFTWAARTLMPLSVVDVQGTRDGSNNLTITWKRRTRVNGNWADGQDVPLGELTEAYEIDVMSGVTVVRTLTSATQSVVYSAANATTDGLPPAGPVTFKLYQISNTVARGFVRAATL